jgi:uncharacterized membrane protein
MLSKVTGMILILATIAAGIYVDIVWLLVGGITEIVHGVEAHPVAGGQIGWGVAHLLFTGIGVFAAVLLCALWAALLLGRSPKRRRAGVRSR